MRIIVTGSRDWPEDGMGMTVVFSTLQGVFNLNAYTGEVLTVVHGACPTGADRLAAQWVERMRSWRANAISESGPEAIEEPHPADWDRWGANAGPIRNREMADAGATFCVAFLYEPEGRVSKGTRDMMRQARLVGIPLIEVPWNF